MKALSVCIFLFACFSSQAFDLSLAITTNSTKPHVYFFPDRRSAEGQVIHIDRSMTVYYQFKHTNNIPDFVGGDMFILSGFANGNPANLVSFNLLHPSVNNIEPNSHSISSGQIFVNEITISNDPAMTNWHTVVVSINTSNRFTGPLITMAACVDGIYYSDTVQTLGFNSIPFTNIDAMILFTNTQTSIAINHTFYELKNIRVIDDVYRGLPLSIIAIKDPQAIDFTLQQAFTFTDLQTNLPATSGFVLQAFGSNWVTLNPPVASGGQTNKPTIKTNLPFFKDTETLYRLRQL